MVSTSRVFGPEVHFSECSFCTILLRLLLTVLEDGFFNCRGTMACVAITGGKKTLNIAAYSPSRST